MSDTTQVLIAGAGPVGLTLAMELNHHGIETLLVERNATSTRHPKMDISNGRTMELFRRLGIADDLREVAVSGERELTVTWATAPQGWELASFTYPPVADQKQTIRESTDGTLPLEPHLRVSQIVIEPAMRDLLEARAKHVTVEYGWGLESFEEDADGVTAHLASLNGDRRTVRAQYLAGCDGAGSKVRAQLGFGLDEIDLRRMLVRQLGIGKVLRSVVRDFRNNRVKPPDGRFYLVHFTTTEPEIFTRFGPAWHLQSPDGWSIISQNDRDTFTLHAPLATGTDAEAIDPREFVYEQLGVRFEMEVLIANHWTPRLTVTDSYGRGRVWLAGDSTHQVTPTGGYGMNTGVGDAIGLGWALAAQLQRCAPGLLTAYEQERRPIAFRNREPPATASCAARSSPARSRRCTASSGTVS
jgi:2-polyprenyl-6-methoxyphenol hydroxylase-like FAD-dependent oxidoreductase